MEKEIKEIMNILIKNTKLISDQILKNVNLTYLNKGCINSNV